MGRSGLERKVRGALYGGAVGDALGSPAEGKEPNVVRDRYGWITDYVEPWTGPSEIGKGDGRFSDDTHMTMILSQIYIDADDELDVFDFARAIVPRIADETRWVPEHGREMPLIERLFYPEKWLLMRLRLANCDPRLGGHGNMVNCGAAMYAAPVGIVHAGDPRAGYREAIEIFGAHQWSYGLEAAGVVAACVAEAFKPGATAESIVGVGVELAHDGTRAAILAVTERARQYSDWREAIGPLRDAMRPFDGAAENIRDRGNGTDDWGPSRVRSIEELPIALALLLVTGGDFEASVLAAANYGRDNDSIGGMVGAMTGAMHGDEVIRPDWISRLNAANRVDLDPLVAGLAALVHRLHLRRFAAAADRAAMFDQLTASA
ncbi:MAG: ADP-ribosylglycohydrolase family protein [Chloroflexota bacterium]|nr:ADP-ribosylglycohydrolase family protein [Chloroflexota bacterium]